MKSIIITGCTSGLGKAFHDKAVKRTPLDTRCVFLGRNLERLEQSTDHQYCEFNLLNEQQVDWERLYSSKRPKSIILISNAGVIHPLGAISSDKSESFRQSVRVNLTAPSELTSSLVLWARSHQIEVTILNISSGAASRAIAGWGAYCMSKAGFKMFLDVIVLENEHVEVVHFDPGVIDTNMQKSIRSSSVEDVPSVDSFRTFAEEGKLKSPEEVVAEIFKFCGLPL
ncbi:SDR family NAD(P)-dependent oxidoreductase [Vibrio gigantis]|uniref:SDR family NAD(P)-dependent oxidoreductase n=1 Tax=Vibrio gigantis TaxID=296199 RepID=UPI001BFD791F|nr:SDR family NAD(P)-dependent oxidoreductase [Vibrio gigantis]